MPLSEYERRILQELERDLVAGDPALARHLASGWPAPRHLASSWPERRSAPRGRWNTPVLLAGLVMVVLGITLQFPWAGAVGLVLLLAGCIGTLVRKYYSWPD